MRSAMSISRAATLAALIAGACAAAVPFGVAKADDPQPQRTQQTQPRQVQKGQPGGAPAAVEGTLVTADATVQKVDTTRGTVTLKTAQGQSFEVKAGPDVDLKRVHPGDRVTTSYYEEVAVAIDPARKPATQLTETTVVRGGVAERQATVTARIVSVDAKKNTVVVATPDGNRHTLEIKDPALRHKLARVKPGEHFDITYTEAVAVAVRPRP